MLAIVGGAELFNTNVLMVLDFLRVLGSVTAGNVLGGGVLVALVYWFVYLRPERG